MIKQQMVTKIITDYVAKGVTSEVYPLKLTLESWQDNHGDFKAAGVTNGATPGVTHHAYVKNNVEKTVIVEWRTMA